MSQLLYKIETALHRFVPSGMFNPRYCLVYQLPCAYQPRHRESLPEFSVRWATEQDRVALVQQTVLSIERLRLGDRVAVVTQGDDLVGTVWIAKQLYSDWDTGLRIELAPHEAWLYGAWIRRDLRGRHLYSHLFAFVCQSLKQESCQSLLLAVDWSNGHSQKVHEGLGGKTIGTIRGIRLFGKSTYRMQRRDP